MEEGSRRMLYLATLSETMIFITIGTVMGWPAPMTERLLEDGYVNKEEASWMASVNNLAIILGSFLITALVNTAAGRKWTLVASAVPLVINWLMLAVSNSPGVLIAARFVAGLGLAVGTVVGPLYLSEVAEPEIRGLITTLLQVAQNVGLLFTYCLGPYVPYWVLSVACAGFPLLFVASFSWMPETPYHLLSRGRREDAVASLLKIRGKTKPAAVEEELQSIERAVSDQREQRRNVFQELRQLLTRARHLRGLLVAGGLFFFQAGSGMVSITAYATSIFTGVDAGLDAAVSTMLLAVVQIVVNLAASFTVDRLGRRLLLVGSFCGCALSMTVVGVYFYLQNAVRADVSSLGWLPLTAIILFFVFYSFGAGPLPWMLLGEVFSPEVKGTALSVVGVLVGLLLFLFVKVFPLAADALGDYVVFWTEAVLSALGALFVLFVVPETRGKTLLQISQDLGNTPTSVAEGSSEATEKAQTQKDLK